MSGYEKVRSLFRKSVPLGLIIVSTAIALLLGELLVRFVANPGDVLFPVFATTIDDPALGPRIKPHSTGHDALGFRNPKVPDRADIVAIGDSMTYGYGVGTARNDSWPHQVGILLNESVYNMGHIGYGPLQYLYLAEHEARKLRPRLLLVGFYFGNDLIDAYNSALSRPYWHGWREVDSAYEGEAEHLKERAKRPKKRFAALRDWLSRNSVFYSLLRVTVLPHLLAWEQDHMAKQAPDRLMVWIDPSRQSVRTTFTSQLRLSAQDPRLPSVHEGLRITKRAFTSLKAVADSQGAQLLVVLIPTKERAYCRYLKDSGERLPDAFVRLCDAEEWVKEELLQHFFTTGIAYVDVTGAMEEHIRKHVQIFPTDSDDHPTAAGYGVITHAVYDAVRRQFGSPSSGARADTQVN